jgi:hypothetical protein
MAVCSADMQQCEEIFNAILCNSNPMLADLDCLKAFGTATGVSPTNLETIAKVADDLQAQCQNRTTEVCDASSVGVKISRLKVEFAPHTAG